LPLIGNQNVWLVVVKDGVRSAPVILDKSINVIPVYPD
jgi:hypothetical protein